MLTVGVVLLGLFAGLTIFISIPVARVRKVPASIRVFLGAFTAGILIFLFWDVMSNGLAPVREAAASADFTATTVRASILLGSFLLAFLGLTVFERLYRKAVVVSTPGDAASTPESSPRPLEPKRAMELIAVGIGLHNFGEGLAIGAAFVAGGLGFATVLFVGFALHNSTEGFGVVGPALASGYIPSWNRLIALGFVAGAPTLFGTLVGAVVALALVQMGFFAVAGGAILYVVIELVQTGGHRSRPELRALGVFSGFALGVLTDLVILAGHG